MGLYKSFVSQTRKPEGVLGRMMLKGMNSGHAKVADWGMDHLNKEGAEAILEIGCGGGRNAGELLKRYPDSQVTAVDYSSLSVEKATEYNREAIESGRCVCRQADVSSLPFGDAKFDLATAFETIYFWPGLENCFRVVSRVLKPGGVFLIVNESDGEDAVSQRFEKIIDGMKIYTERRIEEALKAAGFSEVRSDHHTSHPWLTAVAEKQGER